MHVSRVCVQEIWRLFNNLFGNLSGHSEQVSFSNLRVSNPRFEPGDPDLFHGGRGPTDSFPTRGSCQPDRFNLTPNQQVSARRASPHGLRLWPTPTTNAVALGSDPAAQNPKVPSVHGSHAYA